MAAVKSSGLGDNFYLAGYNMSGDVGSLGTVSGGNAPLDVTGIDKSAMERLGGLRNGTIEFNAFFSDLTSYPFSSHTALKSLTATDRVACYFRGTAIGSPAAGMICKQVNYDPTRAADGSLTSAVQCVSNAYGLEWGVQLTAGLRTDTVATNGASFDSGASLSFGGQAYLQVFNMTGTDATVKIQDSANDSAWSDVATFAFTQITGTRTSERIFLGNTATIRRYIRAISITTGGFSDLTFACMVVKNEIAGQVF